MKQLVLALALVVGAAFAQDTESCRALFERMSSAPDQTAQQAADLRSLTGTTVITQTVAGEPTTVTTFMVVDFGGARVYQATDLGDGNEMVVRYQDGAATMTMMGMDLPAPPGMAEMLKGLFDQMLSGNFGDPAAIAAGSELLSCDGPQDYGVLAGEQLTVRLAQPAALMQNLMADSTTRFIFEGGEVKGTVQTLPDVGTTIMVFEELTQDDAGRPIRTVMRTYTWDGQSATESGLITSELSYDEPLDEALFAP